MARTYLSILKVEIQSSILDIDCRSARSYSYFLCPDYPAVIIILFIVSCEHNIEGDWITNRILIKHYLKGIRQSYHKNKSKYISERFTGQLKRSAWNAQYIIGGQVGQSHYAIFFKGQLLSLDSAGSGQPRYSIIFL